MDGNEAALCLYRLNQAQETLEVANECYQNNHYKDSINRSYYAAFYSIKAILALEKIDFKRHKDVVAYFNKQYVASGIFVREIGRNLGRLQQKREKSDYDDFYIASKEEAEEQIAAAMQIVRAVKSFVQKSG